MADDDLRETSSATTALVLGFVRELAGDEGVVEVLRRAEVPYTLAQLENPSLWVTYDARVRLFEAATAVLGRPHAMFEVGGSALHQGVSPSLVILLRALGSPRQVFRQLPRAVAKFTTTSTMTVVEVGATHATISYRLHDGYRHSRLDCDYAQGLISVVPEIFGLPAAHVVHDECESDGAPACVYHLTWERWSRWSRRRTRSDQHTLRALRGQLTALQSAASDLVSSDDLEQVLDRIIERATAAVLAQGYLLAVHGRTGDATLVRSSGVPPARAEQLAEALLRGDDLGPSAVVVDVRSSRRHHGRLAALYPEGQGGLADERRLLEAYAQHAAAALDLLLALEDSRRGESRAEALLGLAHQLAGTDDSDEVSSLVLAALPRVVGCRIASLLLWDDTEGVLTPAGSVGLAADKAALFLEARLAPGDVPELAQMLSDQKPIQLSADDAGPRLADLLQSLHVRRVLAVPLLAGGQLLGVATASWANDEPVDEHEPDLWLRLQGLADQAATALQNARLVAEIRHHSLHDALTGLANRVLFGDRLDQALLRRGGSLGGIGVLFCDLDGFKQVNDVLGHASGDELLRQVAARLAGAVRGEDSVARLSGDEFAVLLPEVEGVEEATVVARRITACFERPFRVEGEDLRITTSVGVAVHAGPGGRGERLLAAADAAMYSAKQRGRNQIACADAPGPPRARAGTSLETELAAALADGSGLELVYQPVLQLADDAGGPDTVVGLEALVRWRHPRLGLLSPASFMPMAEDSGLVVPLDHWVLRTACCALAQAGPGAPYRIAVNLASRTLNEPSLPAWLRGALLESGLSADQLELELVESRSLVDLPRLAGRLTALRRLGVRIALDDFGTGFSTLTWLHQLPADRLKLDRSFTADLDDTASSAALVRGVVALAAELGLDLVAEGVETPAQLSALQQAGCRLVQGYLLGRPGSALVPEAAAPR